MPRSRKRDFPMLSISILLAMILGIITGGYPCYTNEISTISLFLAMTISLASISFKGIITRDSLKMVLYSIILNYGVLSGLILLISLPFENGLRYGFAMMAAVPPAIVVMPLTDILKGKTEYALLSISSIYLLSILLTPLIIYLLLGKKVNGANLILTTLILIALPLLLSRIVRRLRISRRISETMINACFFLLIFGIVGENRSFLLYNLEEILLIVLLTILRTFGPGLGVIKIGKAMKISMDRIIPLSLFSSFKNDGLAIILCLSLFPERIAYLATIPCVLAVMIEMSWVVYLEVTSNRARWYHG